ncbi:glycosyltransferase [Bombilactobacillus folatiphilus]|uniref:Glycosyltransferase n=1 Tax=Bombilactobacillus folatiphilus TaxID=2923362 RepID=A0ABY4P915_9LACO|nr:glycosyltransferase [Bombilactobacillus folatiphilus]UQS82026.1 glycosyltransferase [Bombilactobacillus folatiphilus]
MVKLTLVMPLYNEAQLLRRSLDSIVAQINQDFELLMINDASTDQTVQIAQEYIQQHANFYLVSQEFNQGISAARNRGIQEARGQLITFIDGDDWLEPQYTDYFIQKFTQQSMDLVTCGFFKESAKSQTTIAPLKRSGPCTRAHLLKLITQPINNPVMGYTWNKVYRLELIRQKQLWFDSDLPLMEDQVFDVQYVSAAQHFYVDSRQLYHYWQHNQSVTHTYNWTNIKSIGRANYRILKTITNH